MEDKFDNLAQKVNQNTEQLVIIDTRLSNLEKSQEKLVTAVRIIAKVGDESPSMVKKAVEELLPG